MMKNVKIIFSFLLFLLVGFQLHQVQAAEKNACLPVYQDVISSISLRYNNAMLNGDITLANGAIMHIVDYQTRNDNAINKWHSGDVIVFTPSVHKEKLFLTANRVINGNLDNAVEPYVIFDNINSPKSCLKIVEIRDGGKFIKLSDNSVWEFSFFNRFSTEDWKVGERVLVSGRGDKNSYNFINLDVGVKHNVYSATGTFVVD